MPALVESEEIGLMPTIWLPWMGDDCRPARIPVTTPNRYVSFQAALNLRMPGEHTGDWHHHVALFTATDNPRDVSIAGQGCSTDTTPSLGNKGIRDMAEILAGYVIAEGSGPVWVANHYRAIVDYAMIDMELGNCPPLPMLVPAETINQWLDTPEQIELLVEEYLKPFRNQLDAQQKRTFDKWIPTVVYLH